MNALKRINTIAVAVSVVLLASCNSDGVILPDEPDTDDGNTGGFRPSTSTSSIAVDTVFEWTPAPGQFINQDEPGMKWVATTTSVEAAQWAQKRLNSNLYVSLGAFGGYIVAGFDHSVANTSGGYEIGVFGNAFNSSSGSSNEPGIVYVMQDTNGNGLPDDTWYELRGSDTFAEGTLRDYEVTYYRPEKPNQPVRWSDNLGNAGEVAYLGMFHGQDYYYPYWIKTDTYTLTGTCLKAKTTQNPGTGNWSNPAFGWGYADNIGEDNIVFGNIPNCNRFRISDAIDADGESVKLEYIDFVKIQTGVMSSAGILGEVSTEVLGIVDLTLAN